MPTAELILVYLEVVIKPPLDYVATFFVALGMTVYFIDAFRDLIKTK